MTSSFADRGKSAEDLVKARLTELALNVSTAWMRLPDARAGSFQATTCDFVACHKGRMLLLEVKEVGHAFRLPHGNFSTAQQARMKRFTLAGAEAYVLVYFTPLKQWRYAELEWFSNREGGSWDMSGFPLKNLNEILEFQNEANFRASTKTP